MDTLPEIFIQRPQQAEGKPAGLGRVHIIGIGGKGRCDINYLAGKLPPTIALFTMDQDPMQPIQVWRNHPAAEPTLLGDKEEALPQVLSGIDTLFIVTGLGGGLGTEETLSLVKAANSAQLQTHVFTSFPFEFEGRIAKARKAVNSLKELGVPCQVQDNDMLMRLLGGNCRLNKAFDTQREWLAGNLNRLLEAGQAR